MSRQARAYYCQGSCVCQTDFCARTQRLLGRSQRRGGLRHDGVVEWCTPEMPLRVQLHSQKSNYTTWLLIISICYHIPVFLGTFLKDMGDNFRPQDGRPKKQWFINRRHFPATLLSPLHRKKLRLSTYTKVLSPAVSKVLEQLDSSSVCGAVEDRIPITSEENTVRFLEEYAQRILPVNIHQEFLYAKRNPNRPVPDGDFFVQAPGVSSMEVMRFCALLNLPTTYDDTTTINIVPTRQLVMAEVPPDRQQDQEPLPTRTLATLQRDNEKPEDILWDDGSRKLPTTGVSFKLSKGGTLTIYPRMVNKDECKRLTNEIVNKPYLFRQYKVQGFNNERRLQAQFHDEATDDFDKEQPGYRYNKATTLKARPLHSLPSLKKLADRCQILCEVPSWNIGTTIVFYRNGLDKMGQHRDDDQGEKLILAVVVDAPETNIRKVEIRSKDEIIILYLQRGDGYSMDGEMQQHYTHGVPEAKETSKDTDGTDEESDRRISVVFRYGTKELYKKDSGLACQSFDPAYQYGVERKPMFGRLRGLYEGYLYSRQNIWEMKAHTSQQKGVSGKKDDGCDAIVVAGKGKVKGHDSLLKLTYSASTGGIGAEGMILSYEKGFLVRVFRTTNYDHENRAVVPKNGFYKQISGKYYRYDGLYEIKSYQKSNQKKDKVDNKQKSNKKKDVGDNKQEYVFQLTRCSVPLNIIAGENYRCHCRGLGTIAN